MLEFNPEKAEKVKEKGYIGKEVLLGARPEHGFLVEDGTSAVVEVTELLGSETYVYVTMEGKEVVLRVDPDINVQVGQNIEFSFRAEKVHLFDTETEINICE
jgi:multiple sugar transport system ATP-binding protein